MLAHFGESVDGAAVVVSMVAREAGFVVHAAAPALHDGTPVAAGGVVQEGSLHDKDGHEFGFGLAVLRFKNNKPVYHLRAP